jgi:hypothetical protein
MMLKIDEFKQLLRENIIDFSFTKLDGTVRIMRGTLDQSKLPEREQGKPDQDKKSSATFESDIVTLWDVDKKDWRSFVYPNIIEIASITKVNHDKYLGHL